MNTNLTPHALAEISQIAESLREIVGEDTEALLDTLDGETDFMDLFGALITAHAEALAFADQSKALADRYMLRVKAKKEGAEAIKRQLLRLMDAVGERSIRHPLATLSIRKGKQAAHIPDGVEDALPDNLVTITRKPVKASVLQALLDGAALPDGVRLTNGSPSLSIRNA